MTQNVHRDSVDYWKSVTDENREIDRTHPSPRLDVFGHYFSQVPASPGMRVLDLGIGYGRFIPVYLAAGLEIHGIDIDQAMLDDLQKTSGHQVASLKQGDASNMPYENDFFDIVVCWGVFDELDQGPALTEISRITKPGGHCLITGKNSNYFTDDEEALAAEKGARAKNHPNHFTRLRDLEFDRFGLEVSDCGCFARRGDMAKGIPLPQGYRLDQPLYEFIIRVRKVSQPQFTSDQAPLIADAYSDTYRSLGND